MSDQHKICDRKDCPKKNEKQDLCNFTININGIMRSFCESCKVKRFKYDDGLTPQQRWYQNNKEKAKASSKRSAKKDPKRTKRLIQQRKKNRRQSDPIFAIKEKVSKSIRNSLKIRNKSKGGNPALKYLPYTAQDLKVHLEAQFKEWMNWQNWGVYIAANWDDTDPSTWKWQVDHIKPHSDFPYEIMGDEIFLKCWDLSNLRPLSAKQNQKDGVTLSRHFIKSKRRNV